MLNKRGERSMSRMTCTGCCSVECVPACLWRNVVTWIQTLRKFVIQLKWRCVGTRKGVLLIAKWWHLREEILIYSTHGVNLCCVFLCSAFGFLESVCLIISELYYWQNTCFVFSEMFSFEIYFNPANIFLNEYSFKMCRLSRSHDAYRDGLVLHGKGYCNKKL